MTTAPEWYVITLITRNQLLKYQMTIDECLPTGGEPRVLCTTLLSSFSPKGDNNQTRLG